MAYLLIAGLTLGAAGAAMGMTVDHKTRIDHHSGQVAVEYRGNVAITHRQVGTVAPGGMASSLRCEWAATLAVARHATAATGNSLSRTMNSQPLMTGSRPGWCDSSKSGIAKEVARRSDDMRDHLMMLAQQDEETLRAELDRAHGRQRAG